jgi:hypothetical protein
MEFIMIKNHSLTDGKIYSKITFWQICSTFPSHGYYVKSTFVLKQWKKYRFFSARTIIVLYHSFNYINVESYDLFKYLKHNYHIGIDLIKIKPLIQYFYFNI